MSSSLLQGRSGDGRCPPWVLGVLLLAALLGVAGCDSPPDRKSGPAPAAPATVTVREVSGHEIPGLLERQGELVVLDFQAEWCDVCQKLQPKLQAAAAGLGLPVIIAKIDVDRSGQAMRDYAVRGIPTACLYLDGREQGRIVGNRDLPEIEQALHEAAAPAGPADQGASS